MRQVYSVGPGDLYRQHKRHPPTILPAEEKVHIRASNFTRIDSEEKLLALMDSSLAARRCSRLRVAPSLCASNARESGACPLCQQHPVDPPQAAN